MNNEAIGISGVFLALIFLLLCRHLLISYGGTRRRRSPGAVASGTRLDLWKGRFLYVLRKRGTTR
jgi:hypothetical protein